MEFSHELIYNFTSVFATILLTLVTFVTVFQKLKVRWPINVNCWFCNKYTKIWRQERDWWLCSSCKQYNGFTKDGDYMYDIPEQYEAPLNKPMLYGRIDGGKNTSVGNGLCMDCNRHEEYKLFELSKFEPTNENNFEYEFKNLKCTLEDAYPLCSSCKTTVQNILQKQTQWLMRYKMLLFKKTPIQALLNTGRKFEVFFKIMLTLLNFATIYDAQFLFSPIGGLLFQLGAYWITSAKNRKWDIFSAFLWICIIVLASFEELNLLRTNIKLNWISLECITQHHLITILVIAIGFVNVKCKSLKTASQKSTSFKKITHVKNNAAAFDHTMAYGLLNDNQSCDNKSVPKAVQTNKDCQSSLNGTINSLSLSPVEFLGVTNPSIIPKMQSYDISQEANALPTRDERRPSSSISLYKDNSALQNSFLDDSLRTLSALSVSDGQPNYIGKSPKMFEKRTYSTVSPQLFRRSNTTLIKRNILSPPKLKSVTQTSWVAGGYWQDAIETPSLSRSSSQSSGFGSAGSNFAPSREPSIHELDRCSVTSDATQSCFAARQGGMNAGGNTFQQNNSFCFVTPKNPSYGQLKLTQHSPSSRTNGTIFADLPQQSTVDVSDIKSPLQTTMLPSHTTIVTSPVWLSALLCCSLVANIIVLCVTFLR